MNPSHKIERLGFALAIADCLPDRKGFFNFPKGLSVRLCFSLTVQPLTFGYQPLRRNALTVFRQGVSQFFDFDRVASAEILLSGRADRQLVVAGLPGQRQNNLGPKPVISASFEDLLSARLLKRHQKIYVLSLDDRAKVLAFDERDSISVSLASGKLPLDGRARRQLARILCSLSCADRACQARQNCYDQCLVWKSHLFASRIACAVSVIQGLSLPSSRSSLASSRGIVTAGWWKDVSSR